MTDSAAEGGTRRVRTPEGARFFGVPIGQVIQDRFSPQVQVAQRSTTLTRLVSLQRQFEVAKETGNLSEMQNVQEEFSAAVLDYASRSGQLPEVLDSLVGARGRGDRDIRDQGGTPPPSVAPTDAPAAAPAADPAETQA